MKFRCRTTLSGLLLTLCSPALLGQIVINEIHYDPIDKTRPHEFIELHNAGSVAMDLGGWRFSNGVEFTFPLGTQIAAGGFLVIAENPSAFQAEFNFAPQGPWTGTLSNDGEQLTLRN